MRMERSNEPQGEILAPRSGVATTTRANHLVTGPPSTTVDSLFIPDAKIVSFAASGDHPSRINQVHAIDEPLRMLQRSSSERTIAVGMPAQSKVYPTRQKD